MLDLLKKFACKVGWHSFGNYELVETPICNKYKCKWCGYIGMVDSQGKFF